MNRTLHRTQSVCPVCLRVVDAKIAERDDGIFLQKTCPEHGSFRALVWEGGAEEYEAWGRNAAKEGPPVDPVPVRDGCPHDCGLCAGHESGGCCVLLELTDRCNLRCPVCFAGAGEGPGRDLSLPEIGALYDLLLRRGGPFNIQLSGGEPTVRDDLPEIIALGREKGFSFFQLNTNGLRLAGEDGYAAILKKAGLSCAFLQFDGLTDGAYRTLRGRPLLEEKKEAIRRCADAGLAVVLVPVVAPGVNEDQAGELLRFAAEGMPAVRGIHFQPVSYFGRCAPEPSGFRITIPRMLRLLEEQTGGRIRAGDFTGGGPENPYCSFHATYLRGEDGTLRALGGRESAGCCCTTAAESRDFVARQWSGGSCCSEEKYPSDLAEVSALDKFLKETRENTFAVSGMLFMDAWNLDLNRLRRCKITEADGERGMIPFCAYNLTDTSGRALYRP